MKYETYWEKRQLNKTDYTCTAQHNTRICYVEELNIIFVEKTTCGERNWNLIRYKHDDFDKVIW